MKRHQVTIIDIAKELNLSKSTVSRALTGHKSVKPDTRQAVLELAEKLDYQRNMLAISLITKKRIRSGLSSPSSKAPIFPRRSSARRKWRAKRDIRRSFASPTKVMKPKWQTPA
ncbi:LacI family DNA-binding transcriptional regulator [Chitinophaga caseinilytica]|uniref:LacI family DNA-binding transcriptional regulator n=1 Tax=Chitinophaga caseinilytica TaxID=2267521 RepID=UPI003CC66381